VEGEDERPSATPNRFERGVYRRLLEEGHRFQFSQAVRLLELMFPEAPAPGETTDYGDAPIRLRPSVDLVFPATDVKRVERLGDDRERVELVVTFLGLYGIDSPMPYNFYERLARKTEETVPHRDFLDLFNHRLYAFFYRAWKKYRPGLHYRPGGRDRHSQRFVSLAGVGTPHALDDVSLSPMRLAAQAGVLAPRSRNAAGLEALIEAFFEWIEAEVIENVPRWVPIPSRSGLGDGGFQLGDTSTIGEQIYDRSGKFRLRLGPMGVDQYLAFLPGGENVPDLHTLVRLYAPDYLEYDVELQVHSETLPTTQLGTSGAELGYTTSVGQPQDPVLRRIVEYDSGASSLAARS
jgi:type VI secretion system protein ImpH